MNGENKVEPFKLFEMQHPLPHNIAYTSNLLTTSKSLLLHYIKISNSHLNFDKNALIYALT